MSSPPPIHQPTVAVDRSIGAWVVVGAIAGLLAAWAVRAFLLPGDRPDVLAVPASVSAPASPKPVTAADRATDHVDTSEVLPPPPPPPPSPTDFERSAQADALPPVTDACDSAIARSGMQLPANFRVLAAGAYGGRELGFQIDQSGHTATQIDVVVSSQDKPVALMLGAYEPTVWKVSWTSGTRIVAVYAGGYHTQRVAGLPKDVPLLISSYEEKSACPYFYVGGEQGLQTVNPAARRVFGRPVDMVYPAGRDGTVFAGGSGPIGGIESGHDAAVESFRDKDAPLAGQAGIEEEIRLGQLRRAGPADSGLWALAQRGRSADLPPVAGQAGQPAPPPPSNLYIVQREMIFPSGLYGAHAVMFLVPPGVPRPKGNPGHSAVFELK